MQHNKRLMIVALIIAGLQLSACAQKSDTSSKIAPAKVERIEGTDLKRVILTAKAAERLGIKTTPMGDVPVAQQRSVGEAVAVVPASTAGAIGMPGQRVDGGPSQRQVVPYAAVLYDAKGDTWVYTNPNPLTFVRHAIHIDYIEGDLAVLSDGLASGTAIVVVGAAELFGAETGIGK